MGSISEYQIFYKILSIMSEILLANFTFYGFAFFKFTLIKMCIVYSKMYKCPS